MTIIFCFVDESMELLQNFPLLKINEEKDLPILRRLSVLVVNGLRMKKESGVLYMMR